ncbi:hypothetical protein [Bosea sp. PAMC 26642]|uniref:hypothetical protein n=1 Tax=Bosea sp. (strain PAMC 26642) TaxID=1792307 RepID=UPI000770163D|nr:hypothetical protein [Bosea sp. PAMC 26642]AMJ60956.1 hypothetical protein AXW83_12200 [Bosea sp. PAMC 26642]
MSDSPKIVAHHAMASDELELMRAYVQNGRRWRRVLESELRSLFILHFAEWEAAPLTKPVQLNDVICEYKLRGLAPPYDDVKDDLNAITKAIAAAVANLPADEHDRINQSLIDDFVMSTKNKQ